MYVSIVHLDTVWSSRETCQMVKQIDYNLEDHNRKVVEWESHLFQPEVLFECPVLFYLVLNLQYSGFGFLLPALLFLFTFWLFYLLRDLWEQTEVIIPLLSIYHLHYARYWHHTSMGFNKYVKWAGCKWF